MSRAELLAIIEELRAEHGKDFEAWYDHANYPSIKDYCEIGWLIERHYHQGIDGKHEST